MLPIAIPKDVSADVANFKIALGRTSVLTTPKNLAASMLDVPSAESLIKLNSTCYTFVNSVITGFNLMQDAVAALNAPNYVSVNSTLPNIYYNSDVVNQAGTITTSSKGVIGGIIGRGSGSPVSGSNSRLAVGQLRTGSLVIRAMLLQAVSFSGTFTVPFLGCSIRDSAVIDMLEFSDSLVAPSTTGRTVIISNSQIAAWRNTTSTQKTTVYLFGAETSVPVGDPPVGVTVVDMRGLVLPISAPITTNYTLTALDANKVLRVTAAATISLPAPGAQNPLPIGFVTEIRQSGNGAVVVQLASDNGSGPGTLNAFAGITGPQGQHGSVRVHQTADGVWNMVPIGQNIPSGGGGTGANYYSVRSQATDGAPTNKLFDDELTKKEILLARTSPTNVAASMLDVPSTAVLSRLNYPFFARTKDGNVTGFLDIDTLVTRQQSDANMSAPGFGSLGTAFYTDDSMTDTDTYTGPGVVDTSILGVFDAVVGTSSSSRYASALRQNQTLVVKNGIRFASQSYVNVDVNGTVTAPPMGMSARNSTLYGIEFADTALVQNVPQLYVTLYDSKIYTWSNALPATVKVLVVMYGGNSEVPSTAPPAGVTVVDRRNIIVPSRIITGDYTYNFTEQGYVLRVTASTPTTITLPLNAGSVYPIGASFEVRQSGAGAVTVVGASGVTINAFNNITGPAGLHASVRIQKTDTNTWNMVPIGQLGGGGGTTIPDVTTAQHDSLVAADWSGNASGGSGVPGVLSTSQFTPIGGTWGQTFSTGGFDYFCKYWAANGAAWSTRILTWVRGPVG